MCVAGSKGGGCLLRRASARRGVHAGESSALSRATCEVALSSCCSCAVLVHLLARSRLATCARAHKCAPSCRAYDLQIGAQSFILIGGSIFRRLQGRAQAGMAAASLNAVWRKHRTQTDSEARAVEWLLVVCSCLHTTGSIYSSCPVPGPWCLTANVMTGRRR